MTDKKLDHERMEQWRKNILPNKSAEASGLPLDRHSGDDESPEGYEATNWDGSKPEIVDGTIWIKVLDCYPDCGCGGCFTREVNHPIDGNRFHYQNART